MKKKHCIILVAILLILAAAAGTVIHTVRSPEYALTKIFKDVKDLGAEGLYPHLTDEAKKTFDDITSISESKLVGSILTLFKKSEHDYIEILKSKIKETTWDLTDILKSKNRAAVILSFNCQDKLTGTVEISMIRDKEGWKINRFSLPEFNKVGL